MSILCVSYRRVSTQKQVIEGEGLEIQLDRINAFCEANGYQLVQGGDFADEGFSGAIETINRDGIMAMINFCKGRNSSSDTSQHVKHVIIDKVDRLSRELFQQLFIEKQLLVYGVTILFSAQETLNSQSEADKAMINLMRQMMGAFAEFERTLIKQRLNDGIKKKVSKGDKPVGRQPFGYMYDDEKYGTVVNETEAAVVEAIFLKRIQGHSLQKIADYINEICTFTLRMRFNKIHKERIWTRHSIRDILTNDYYYGIVTHGRKKVKGNHEAIIDERTWIMANGEDSLAA